METRFFANKKTQHLYALLAPVLNATNDCPEEKKALNLYVDLSSPDLYVREVAEFKDKFEPSSEAPPEAILQRQITGCKYPLLDILCGFVAKMERISGPLIPAVQEEYLKILTESGDAEDAEVVSNLTEAMLSVSTMEAAGLFQTMLVKIQRPLSSNVENPGCLVYNEERTFLSELSMDSGIMDLFNDELKIYAYARLWADGTFQVVCPVDEQPW